MISSTVVTLRGVWYSHANPLCVAACLNPSYVRWQYDRALLNEREPLHKLRPNQLVGVDDEVRFDRIVYLTGLINAQVYIDQIAKKWDLLCIRGAFD